MTAVIDACRSASEIAPALAHIPTDVKNRALEDMAAALERETTHLLAGNQSDTETALREGVSGALVDRLTLTSDRIKSMAASLRAVADQPDPVGAVVSSWTRPNGLKIERVRVPLGVVAVIFEARPNVTADISALCLKSGNACVLRGSSMAASSNDAIVEVLRSAAIKAGVPENAIQLITSTNREAAVQLMQAKGLVDLLVPRGGAALIDSVEEHATVPYIIDGAGNCHVYVDRSADLEMATRVIVNAKTQRPTVCNAAETLLVHADLGTAWLQNTLDALADRGVEIRGDERVCELWPRAKAAGKVDWATEYLDLVLAVGIVDSAAEAMAHINRWGTSNADAVVTQDISVARRFAREIDTGTVFVNASTRFSDGGEFGFGAEIGISTQKLQARGPMGLEALTTTKYIVWGDGQVRQ